MTSSSSAVRHAGDSSASAAEVAAWVGAGVAGMVSGSSVRPLRSTTLGRAVQPHATVDVDDLAGQPRAGQHRQQRRGRQSAALSELLRVDRTRPRPLEERSDRSVERLDGDGGHDRASGLRLRRTVPSR